jgi:hypothetical protein
MHVVPVCVTSPQPSYNFQKPTFQQQPQPQQQQHQQGRENNFDANFLFVPEPSDVIRLRSSPYHVVPSPADSFVSSTSSFDARSPTMFSPSGVNFTNILRTFFFVKKCILSPFLYLHFKFQKIKKHQKASGFFQILFLRTTYSH